MASKIGEWAFIIGVIVAVVVGLFSSNLSGNVEGWLILLLVVLGLIVGLLNVTEKETTPFLVASAALILVGTTGTHLSQIDLGFGLGKYLENIVQNIAVFAAPAAIVVALKALQSLAKD